MAEIRQDPTTRNWVIIAPERGLRPHDAGDRPGDELPSASVPTRAGATCPFCPGNEMLTPPEIWRSGTPAGWRVRVVPNKFPALVPTGGVRRVRRAGMVSMGGHGHHELIIESPRHDFDLATATDAEVAEVLHAYRLRHAALRTQGDSALIVIFRNHGQGSGTSLEHPHSQVVATPVVPLRVRRRFDVARQHWDDAGTCLYEELARREIDDEARLVDLCPEFVAFVPFAASGPYEIWIIPRARQASFDAASDAELGALASLLRRTLAALRRAADDPPYNLVLHSAPAGDERCRYFLWHLQVVPRLSTPAGFELGTGIAINPVAPETSAAQLRAAAR